MKTLNLYKYKTPGGAAKALYKYLVELANESEYDGKREVFIRTPEESDLNGNGPYWHVSWESGPFEWASKVSGGGSIYGGYNNPPEIKLFDDDWKGNGRWHVEPYYSFDLFFYPD